MCVEGVVLHHWKEKEEVGERREKKGGGETEWLGDRTDSALGYVLVISASLF